LDGRGCTGGRPPAGVYEQLITDDLVRRIGDIRHETACPSTSASSTMWLIATVGEPLDSLSAGWISHA
jgi:hypothetical protein